MSDPNSRVTPAALAAALRCSAAPPAPERDCDGCPYYVTEGVPDELVDQFGDTWTYCDVERMARDAADMIESTIGDPERFVVLPVRPARMSGSRSRASTAAQSLPACAEKRGEGL